jgi:hypothetical protein
VQWRAKSVQLVRGMFAHFSASRTVQFAHAASLPQTGFVLSKGKGLALFWKFFSVLVSRSVLMVRWVLACFNPLWPILILAVA